MTASPERAAAVTQEQSMLDRIVEETEREKAKASARYLPTLTVQQFTEREKQLKQLRDLLVPDVDYGVIQGTDKPTLYLPGAQKLCAFFGYVPRYERRQIEDWIGEAHGSPFFYYDYTCTLFKGQEAVGEAQGSCNSFESKYRYRWVSADVAQREHDLATLAVRGGRISEPCFAVDKAETNGKYGKPMAHWQAFRDAIEAGTAAKIKKPKKDGGEMDAWEIDSTLYRIPNPDICDVVNTVQKMGQKRAYVGATLSATGASQYFHPDLDDTDLSAIGIDTNGAPHGTRQAQQNVAERRIKEERANMPPVATGPASSRSNGGSHDPTSAETQSGGLPQRAAEDDPNAEANKSTFKKMLEAFADEKARLGEQLYHDSLLTYGEVAHSNEFRSMAKARAVYKQLKALTPEPVSDFKATDDDLPAALTPAPHVPELLKLQTRLVEARRGKRFNEIMKARKFANIAEVPPEAAEELAMALNDALAD